MGRQDAVSAMLLTSALSMIFPINIIPAVQSLLELWRERDYAFILGVIASLILSAIRNPLVGALTLLALTVAYHLLRKVKPTNGLGPLWFLSLASVALIYYSPNSWGLINYIDSLRRWWEGSPLSLPPLYLALAFTSASVTYSLFTEVIESKNFTDKVLNYLKDNLGALPVLAFMACLIAAAVYLAVGYEGSANKLAELAYYFLVLGVGLQVYEAVRRKGGGS